VNWTDRTWIKQLTTRCSFCGLVRDGGVSGQGTGPRVYICPDCIRRVHEMLETPPHRSEGAVESVGEKDSEPG
jgi:hypothetical protein